MIEIFVSCISWHG